ncbi:MAG: viroplasmin family protein [Xanthomonadales bacterium]|nr:viroplasmin family protein [Xanthomonadales bacterium]
MAAKFYVVWAGRKPGIYRDWESCRAQVDKFPGARFKSFGSRSEADAAYSGNRGVVASTGSTSASASAALASAAVAKVAKAAKRRSAARSPKTWTAKDIAALAIDVKIYADGALGSRGAALLADYSDEPGNRGLLIQSPEHLREIIDKAAACGVQPAVHAIGDRANREVLDAYAALTAKQRQALRPRIEHAQVVAMDDIPRFAELGVIASMQPTHATSDMPWAGDRVGAERLRGAYAWRRYLDRATHMAFGSDFPVENVEPIPGLYAAITRQDAEGSPEGGWLPDQRLTLVEALDAFTRGAAYAGFAENEVGTLEPGMRADFIVLSMDPHQVRGRALLQIKVRSTWLDGRKVTE